jgi:iron(III) transport system permease protein
VRVLLIPVLVLSAIIVGLLGFVVWVSFSQTNAGDLTFGGGWANYAALLQNVNVGSAVSNTLEFAAITVLIAFAFGLPLAWLSERTDLPGRKLIWVTMLASLVIPAFLLAMGWLFILHPRIGFLNALLMQWFHLDAAPLSIMTVGGMAWVEGISLAPLVFILVAPSMKAIDYVLEEAAMMAGASPFSTFRRVTLPLIAPALIAAVIYTLIHSIGAFDIPAVIGLSGRIYTFSTFLYVLAYPVNGFPVYTTTAAGGGLMIVVALALSVVYSRVLAKARQYQVVSGKAYRPRLVELGRWKVAGWIFACTYAVLVLILPLGMTIIFSLLPYTEQLSPQAFGHLTLANFAAIPWDLLVRGGLNTLTLVILVPLLVVAASCAFSWVVLRSRTRGRLLFDSIAFLPHAVPGVLFALGATLVALFVLRRFIPIYGTIFMLIFVYTIGWISFGTRITNSALIQIHPDLEEAGAIAGARGSAVLSRITLPLLKPALSGLWLFTVLLCLRELTLAAFISTPSNLTLPMVSWTLWTDGSFTQAAAVATLIVLAIVPLLLLFLRFGIRAETMLK